MPVVRTPVEVNRRAIQRARLVLVELVNSDGDADPERLTDTWVVEKSLQVASAAVSQFLDLNSVRTEMRGLYPEDDFDELGEDSR